MLFKKMLRELWLNKVQFLSILIISFLGVFVYSGLTSIGLGMESSSEKYYKETNLADAICYSMGFSDEAVAELKKSSYIEDITRRLTLDAVYEKEQNVTLQLNYIESDRISGFHVVEGEEFSPDSQGIYIDSYFAKEHNIKVGDTIHYTYGERELTSKVAALILQPDYLYSVQGENQIIPNHKAYGYAFLSSNELPKDQLIYSHALIKSKTDNKDIVVGEIEKVVKNVPSTTIMKKDFPSYAMFKNEIKQMSAVGTIFPMVFLLIAVLTTLTTMVRITSNQRLQIGTLKALGFSNGRIIRHYVSYGIVINLISSIVGLILGPVILPATVFGFQKEMYSMPYWEGKTEVLIYIVILISVLISGFCCYYACRSQLDTVVAKVLRPKPVKSGKKIFLEGTKLWRKSGFCVQWNVRDLSRNFIRSFVTVLGIVGCMMLILCGIGMKDTTSQFTNEVYGKLHKYNTKVVLSEASKDLQRENDAQYIMEGTLETKGDKINETVSLTVVSEGNYLAIQDLKGKEIEYPKDGIAISKKTAEKLNLKVKDTIEWKLYGDENYRKSTISVIIKTPMGQGIYMSQQVYEKSGYEFLPTSFLTMKDANTFSSDTYESIQTKADLIKSIDSMLEMMNAIIAIMIVAAIVLGIVVLYNLGVMSFHEKTRELATLKVLGFQYKRLTTLLRQQNSWLTIIGILVGIPCGYLLLANMMSFMGDSMDMAPQIKVLSYIGSSIGIYLLSMIVNRLLSKKLKTIDMVSALKSIE